MKCIIVLLCSLGAKNCIWIKMTEKLLNAGVPSAKKISGYTAQPFEACLWSVVSEHTCAFCAFSSNKTYRK